MSTARSNHTATLLNNGSVLVAGGYARSYIALKTAEIFDPLSGTWSPTDSMTTARWQATATLLPSGVVLLVGGFNRQIVALGTEIYDPALGLWKPAGQLTTARCYHTATLIQAGVLVAGGVDSSETLTEAELCNPWIGPLPPR